MDNNKTFVICNYVGSRELSERFRVAVGAGSNFQSRKSLWVSWSHQERWNLCCRSRCILSRCKRLVNSSELVAYRGKVCFWRTDILNLRNCPGSCTHRALCKSPNFGKAAYRWLFENQKKNNEDIDSKFTFFLYSIPLTFAIGHFVPVGNFPDTRCFATDLHLCWFVWEREVLQAFDVTVATVKNFANVLIQFQARRPCALNIKQ